MIRIQHEDFDVAAEYRRLCNRDCGAVVTFSGNVREEKSAGREGDLQALYLEHYPGMTEKALQNIVDQAGQRWSLGGVTVIHRIGEIPVGGQIVFVGVASGHRGEAFAACEFIMDFLKTRAPFWKRERRASGERWVEAKHSDSQKAARWK